mgnify:CR=1 FL=1
MFVCVLWNKHRVKETTQVKKKQSHLVLQVCAVVELLILMKNNLWLLPVCCDLMSTRCVCETNHTNAQSEKKAGNSNFVLDHGTINNMKQNTTKEKNVILTSAMAWQHGHVQTYFEIKY